MAFFPLSNDAFKISFEEAKAYRMNYGKFKGMSLDDIAKTNEGLLYLDWAVGEINGEALKYIAAYVSHPMIKREIEEALDEREYNRD